MIQISTPAATRTIEAFVFRYGSHDLILGIIRGLKQFINVDNYMNYTTQIAKTLSSSERVDRNICDLQNEMDKLMLDMNSVIDDISKRIT